MKAKMIKKILAVMLAASTVMTMSGLVMAAKKAPGSGKSHGASKTPAQSGRKVMKLKKIKARGKGKSKKDKQFKQQEGVIVTKITSTTPIEISDNWGLDTYSRPVVTFDASSVVIFGPHDADLGNYEPSSLDPVRGYFYTSVMGKADMLSQDCCNDEFVLKTTNAIRRLKHNHLTIFYLKDCPEGKEQELVNALISWAKSDNITVKRNIAVAIGDLAQEGFFDDLSREKKQDIFGALVNCFDRDPSIKPDVAWAFKRLVDRGFVNENENLEEVLRLQEILNDCKDSCDVEPHLDIDDDCDCDCDSDSDSCEI